MGAGQSDTRAPLFAGCEHLPVLYNQQEAQLEAIDSGGNIVGSTYTAADGTYSLPNTGAGPFTVRATLAGENWDVITGINAPIPIPDPPTSPCAVFPQIPFNLSSTASSGQSGVDFSFNSSPHPEQLTAAVNAHESVRIAREYWKSVLGASETPLDDHFLVVIDFSAISCGANFAENGRVTPWLPWDCDHAILIYHSSAQCSHPGNQSVVVHEYGHLVSITFLGHVYGLSPAFLEGYSDATSAIVLEDASGSVQPDVIWPEAGGSCGLHARRPISTTASYPVCSFVSQYDSALVLAALWAEMRRDISSLSHVRSMFGAWSVIAVPPGDHASCAPNEYDQSAGPNTLIEVLIADDDDGNLTNGTPNETVICSTFSNRGINPTEDIGVCNGDSVQGGVTMPDCDDSGSLDIFDYLCFSDLFALGDIASDLDGNSVLDMYDFARFQLMYQSSKSANREEVRK